MLRWMGTGLIVALGTGIGLVKYSRLLSDPLDFWSRVAGYAMAPLFLGAVGAGVYGLFKKNAATGQFHRRLNCTALILCILSTLGQVGQKLN